VRCCSIKARKGSPKLGANEITIHKGSHEIAGPAFSSRPEKPASFSTPDFLSPDSQPVDLRALS